MEILFWLLVGHAVCDYPLQGDFLARAKNHTAPISGVPWVHGLLWHAMIHGGAVALVTGSLSLGAAEIIAHAAIDHAKCAGFFNWARLWAPPGFRRQIARVPAPLSFEAAPPGSARGRAQSHAFHIDQLLHVACKVAWAVLATT